MYLRTIATATPSHAYSQSDCWQILQKSQSFHSLTQRSQGIVEKILMNDNGIDRRHFAMQDVEGIFDLDAQTLNEGFEEHGQLLVESAVREACENAEIAIGDLDGLIVATCTGYVCPGLSSFAAERLGMRSDVYLNDMVGLGCGAALPSLRAGSHFLAAHPEAKVAVVQVEVCSAAFYMDDDIGVLVSMCLFGDGCAASIWSGEQLGENDWKLAGFQSVHQPEGRDLLRFVNDSGKLKNKLHRSVPEVAGKAVKGLHERMLDTFQTPPEALAVHPGGRDVIDAIHGQLPEFDYGYSRDVLRKHGNMSSPSVVYVLKNMLSNGASDKHSIDLTAFGAGFTGHMARLSR